MSKRARADGEGADPATVATVRLNVGGTHHEVSRSLLLSAGGLLASLASGQWTPTLDGTGRVFLDRDGDVFGGILTLLRSGVDLRALPRARLAALRAEADWLSLDGLCDSLERALGDRPVALRADAWARVRGGTRGRARHLYGTFDGAGYERL